MDIIEQNYKYHNTDFYTSYSNERIELVQIVQNNT